MSSPFIGPPSGPPTRPQTWQPLADGDPIPGDPQAVIALAGSYARTAERVGEQIDAVRRVGEQGDWRGSAADAFSQRARELPHDLDLVGTRLHRVAQALRDFAPALAAAQARARAALARAQAVPPRDPHDPMTGGLFCGVEDPETAAAQRQLAQACAERDDAARRCARRLAAAGHDHLRNPSAWHRLLVGVSRWAAAASAWLGVAALVLCWVPGLGEVLGGLTLAAGLLALASDSMLAAGGDASWGNVGLDLLGVVPFGKAARIGAVMSRESAVARAARMAAHSQPLRSMAGRALRPLATGARFESTRGLHAAAELSPRVPGARLVDGLRDLHAAVQLGARTTWPAVLRSPGGLAHEIARARSAGRLGTVWLSGGYGVDAVQAGLGLRSTLSPATPSTPATPSVATAQPATAGAAGGRR